MLGVVALWSVVPVLVKLLVPVVDPFSIAFLRLSQGAVTVTAVYLLRGRRLTDLRVGGWHVLGGLGIGANYALFSLSLSLTTASAGVLIVQVQYVTLTVLAALVLRERLGPRQVVAMGLVLTGVALVVFTRGHVTDLVAPDYASGNAVMLLAGLSWGVYGLCNKVLAQQFGTLATLVPILTIGAAVTGVLAAFTVALLSPPSGADLAIAVFLGTAATGCAFILVSKAMERLSAALLGALTTISPVTAIALAFVMLGEKLSWGLVAGGAVILIGILSLVLGERPREPATP